MLNMDFSQRVVIDTNNQQWVPSPKAGVWRKPLAREEAERGHATSIVEVRQGISQADVERMFAALQPIEIEAAPGVLTIRPSAHPRAGWAEAAAAFDPGGLLDEMSSTRFDDEEWSW